MNICLFSRIIREHGVNGGMEAHGDLICRALLNKGHKITVITGGWPDGAEFEDKCGIKIYYLSGVPAHKYTGKWWKRSVEKFEEIQKKEKFDIIWSQSAGALGWLRFLRNKYPVPCIATIHGRRWDELKTRARNISSVGSLVHLFLSFLKALYYKFTWERNFRLLDAAIIVSLSVVGPFRKAYGLVKEKVFYIPNGIDLEFFRTPLDFNQIRALREKYSVSAGEKILLTTGRLEKEKGVHLAIKALHKILLQGLAAKLLIAGAGSYESELKKLSKKLKIENNVIFCGSLGKEDLPAHYQMCDLYLMPTQRYEAFPFVLIEAMACANPIIASNIGGIPYIIDDGINGVLIPAGDVDTLAEKISLLLNDKQLADKLAKNAQEKAVKEFNQEKMVSDTIEVFEKCLKENKPC